MILTRSQNNVIPSFCNMGISFADDIIEFKWVSAALKNAFSGLPTTSAIVSAEYSRPATKHPVSKSKLLAVVNNTHSAQN